MFVIGKSQKPRCCKNIKKLPCRYRDQKKNWMDSTLFEEWVRELDNQFEKENWKIAFIIDKSSDKSWQGVIRSLKARYRTKEVQKMIEAIDGNKSLPNTSVLRLQTRPCKITSKKQVFVRLKRMMQYLMIHSPCWKIPSRNSLIWTKHLKMSLLRMSHLLMTRLCQHKGQYLMRISWLGGLFTYWCSCPTWVWRWGGLLIWGFRSFS